MDLLATVRKEGSRGGRGDFKWSDVETSSRRENYLGHSLMAPVGRWQKGRDLGWYAKGDAGAADGDEDAAAKAARERKEEIQRVKQAEEDALARALGLPVAPRNNPNMEELGTQRHVGKFVQESVGDTEAPVSRGVGYGRVSGPAGAGSGEQTTERLEGTGTQGDQDRELQYALKEYNRRHGEREHRSHGHGRSQSRSRSRSREADGADRRRRRHREHRHGGREHQDRPHGRREARDRDRSRRRHRSHRERSTSPLRDHGRRDHPRSSTPEYRSRRQYRSTSDTPEYRHRDAGHGRDRRRDDRR